MRPSASPKTLPRISKNYFNPRRVSSNGCRNLTATFSGLQASIAVYLLARSSVKYFFAAALTLGANTSVEIIVGIAMVA